MTLYERVHALLKKCLINDEALANAADANPALVADKVVIADAVVHKLALSTAAIAENREEIRSLLNEMDRDFHADGGGGMSMMRMPMDKNGAQWGEQRDAAFLTALGIAAGMARYTMPRDFWPSLPGGMPYVTIDTREP